MQNEIQLNNETQNVERVTANTKPTMSSKEMSELTGIRHDSVKRTIKSLIESNILSQTQIVDGNKSANGVVEQVYLSDKRDSLVIVARLSPEFTAQVIDRWQELENNQPVVTPLQKYTDSLLLVGVPSEVVPAIANTYVERDNLKLEVADKTKTLDRLLHTNKTYTATELAKECGFRSARMFNLELYERKIQFPMNNTWVLYAYYAQMGYTIIKQQILDSGKIVYYTEWTDAGRDFVLKLFSISKSEYI